jgi:membrane protease YdiL (CAAX protease family)
MTSLWQRLPVVVRAVLAGAAVSVAGIIPWVLFVSANQKVLLSVPWAIVPTALYLWMFWRYLRGEGWPRSTAEARRSSLRANALSADVWGMSIFAGMLGLMALLPLVGLMGRLVRMPSEAQSIHAPPGMPFVTVFLLLVMASIVAGVVEEAAFRGYMQGPIERRHGPIVALLLSGSLFGLAHYTHHPDSMFAMMPFYLAVVAIYGGLAYLTNSILPSLVLHAGGDVFSLTRLWATGQPEWQVSSTAPKLIWETGPDAGFWGYVTALVILGGAALWAYVSLAAAVRSARARGAQLSASVRTRQPIVP